MSLDRAAPIAALLLCGAASAAAADQSIDIGPSIAYTPSSVTVAPGETVTWNWKGSPHSSTSNATSGPDSWNSGIQGLGATFSHTFQTLGDHPFYCMVHSCPTCTTMNGVVHVVAPTVTPTPLPSATPTPRPGGGAAPIPALSGGASAALAAGLAAAALLLLGSSRPR